MGDDLYEDTSPGFGMDQAILDQLYQISNAIDGVNVRLDKLEGRMSTLEPKIEATEEQTGKVVRDLNVIHQFQKSYRERLSAIELMMIDEPLLSSTPPPKRCSSVPEEVVDDVK